MDIKRADRKQRTTRIGLSVLVGTGLLVCTLWLTASVVPSRADPSPPEAVVQLTGLWKGLGLASRYVITNQGTTTATTAHTFYDAQGALITITSDLIPSGTAHIYDLAVVADLPIGFRGSVTVTANQPITGALIPFLAYLPLVMRNYRPPPPPPVYPNDASYGSQWGLTLIRAPEAWALSKGTGVLIAILDTGTNYYHPDLSGKVRTDIDWDFIHNDGDAMDDHGHGTHVSGIAAATTNNTQGVAGLGWEATVLPLKVLNAQGRGSTDQLIPAIRYAADRGAKVINMSLGGPYPCPSTLQDAVNYAHSRGVLLVAAAGNRPDITVPAFPANCTHVLGVAATTSRDTMASFSNSGAHVSVAAPGEAILSTCQDGNYCYMSGTSMATPFVAGLAALVYARFPTYTPDQVASAILDQAKDLGPSGWDVDSGCGRIDAFATLWEGAEGNYPVCLGARVWGPEGQKAREAGEVVPGEVVVTVRAGGQAERLFGVLGLAPGSERLYTDRSGVQVWRLRVPVGLEEAIVARLRADPTVIAADRNFIIRAQ
ncbi:MAG: S8 family peptidase [Anaerolineae bacterium]|nr:S8 family peptidase [Anaerolineae bacterium]MDW8067878.1 S8 family peptidase [Anaerolineae bacterium]